MTNQMIAYEETRSQMLMPVANLMIIKEVYQAKKEFVTSILKKGVDFGNVPGSDKPTLLKPGAEKMTSFFGLAPTFDDIEKTEDWTGDNHSGEPFFYYRLRCSLWRNVNGARVLVASADGSCNSWEKKYRYRKNNRKCPACGYESIIKGKAEYGGGWLCFKNKGGCGAKYKDGDPSIEAQETGQIKNPDVAEQVNTILKMAQKRALIAATLIATGTSEYFTQDIEDFTNTTEHIDAEFVAVDESPMVEPEPEILPGDLWHDFPGVKVEDMPLEMAQTATNHQGKSYSEIDNTTLQNMAAQIAKLLKAGKKKDGPVTDEERMTYNFKLSAIRAILLDRERK